MGMGTAIWDQSKQSRQVLVRPKDFELNPLEWGDCVGNELEEEEEDVELPDGVETKRIGLPREGKYLKKMGDPRLPSQEE
eukprot:3482439-Karenia_brevis.AAC.1